MSPNATFAAAIPFAAAVLARSERRAGSRHRTPAEACAQAWARAEHSGDEALVRQARLELAATCRADRSTSATRQVYGTLIDTFEDLPGARGVVEYDLAVLLSEAWQRGENVSVEDALAHFDRASVMLMVDGDTAVLAQLETDQAVLEFASGDTASAVMSIERALERWRALGNELRVAETLLTLGDCLDAADQPGGAIRRYREAETLFRALGDSLSANAAAVRAELVVQRSDAPTLIDLRRHR
ncbi:MAG: tetratricopeptide repeat protein [Acidimicrobiia bacterium]